MKKLFMLLNTVSFVFCSTANGSDLVSPFKGMTLDETRAAAVVEVPQVKVRRVTAATNTAGKYFAKKAFVRVELSDEEERIEVPFLDGHEAKLNDMDLFLQQNGWKRNHLCADLFAMVYDTRDEQAKVLDGTLLARKESDNEYTFAIRAGNTGINGYKFADFVSSPVPSKVMDAMDANAANYEMIDSVALRPVTDKDGSHGDRLALDTIKTNPQLFFNLISRTAHREDLKIISMGIRYTSSYDACNPCFEKIFDARNGLNVALNAIATSQGYSVHNSIGASFSTYGLFYSARPYFNNPELTYVANWVDAAAVVHAHQTNIPFTFPGPSYSLDLNGLPAVDRAALTVAPPAVARIHMSDNVYMNPARVYHNCRELTLDGAVPGQRIPYSLGDAAPAGYSGSSPSGEGQTQ